MAGVLGLAAGLGPLALAVPAAWYAPLVLLAAGLPLGGLALRSFLTQRPWQPVAIIAAASFVPLGVPTGTQSPLQLSLLLTLLAVLAWLIYGLATRRFHPLAASPVNGPLLAFMAVTAWSIGWSMLFRDPLVYAPPTFLIVQVAAGATMILLPAAALLTNSFVNDVRILKWLTGLTLAAGAVFLLDRYNLVPLPLNLTGLFNMWVIALAASLALFVRRLGGWARVALLALAGAYTFWGFVLHTNRLAAWIPGLVALGVLLWLRSRRAFLLAALVVVGYIGLNMDYFISVRDGKQVESGDTRAAAWEVNWRITKDHLLFGTGPAGYAAYYMAYFPAEGMATHNNYIDIIAETGVTGFACYAAAFAVILGVGWRVSRRVRGRGDFVEALAHAGLGGILGSLVIMGFGDWVIPFAYTQTIRSFDYEVQTWLFIGAVLVLDRLTRPAPVLRAATGGRDAAQ